MNSLRAKKHRRVRRVRLFNRLSLIARTAREKFRTRSRRSPKDRTSESRDANPNRRVPLLVAPTTTTNPTESEEEYNKNAARYVQLSMSAGGTELSSARRPFEVRLRESQSPSPGERSAYS
jgi:hypothetical protein